MNFLTPDEKSAFLDALDTYYRLKSEYETSLNKYKSKIVNNQELSWREKRNEFRKLKEKCVNCKRPVGTIFSQTYTENSGRVLKALCGDRASPCPLNIHLILGNTELLVDEINRSETELSDYKTEIINAKNNLLFGYTDKRETVSMFNRIKENLEIVTKNYDFFLQQYLNIRNNKKRAETLQKSETDLYVQIELLKTMMNEYNDTKNFQIVVDIISQYKNVMGPLEHAIMDAKYAYNAVERHDDMTFHLIQQPYTVEQMEVDFNTDGMRLVHNKMGVAKKARTTAKPVAGRIA